MTFLLPVLVFLLALTISLIVIRVGTMALMLTGLSREAARFQAHSAFTSVGFTTSESESIVNHPVRRHLTMGLMMLGNIGMATVIATLTATLLSAETGKHWGASLFVLALGVLVLYALFKSPWIEQQFNRPIAFALRQFTKLDVRDYVSLLELSSGFAVTEMVVEVNDWVAGKTLVELGLAREGVLILGIRRESGAYLGAPSSANRIEAGDTLVIYGPVERIEELDSRCLGQEGDRAHQTATKEYDEYLDEVKEDEQVTAGSS
ncbi:MAG: TrkA C-terminal domain-containing protein [Planctomycetota bacterium]